MPTTRCYYEVLGVPRNVSPDEIKRAYRRMAMKHHPDRNPADPAAEARFREAAESYEVLSDPGRRQLYDQHGHAGLRSTPGHDFRSMRPEDIFSMFEDIFGGVGSRGRRATPTRGLDLETEVEITLQDVLHGVERDIDITRLGVCGACAGSGARPGTTAQRCESCEGRGQVAQAGLSGMFRMVTTCPACRGQGSIVRDPCGECSGRGRVPVRRRLAVRLPAGIHDGQAVRVSGEGEPPPRDAGVGDGARGDLHVIVRVLEHDRFERDGAHLLVAMPIAFTQAALGSTIEVPTLDGDRDLAIPAGTQHGELFRIDGAGLQDLRTDRRGDLVVIIQLVVPRRLTDSQRTLLEEYGRTENRDLGPSGSSLWNRVKNVVQGNGS